MSETDEPKTTLEELEEESERNWRQAEIDVTALEEAGDAENEPETQNFDQSS